VTFKDDAFAMENYAVFEYLINAHTETHAHFRQTERLPPGSLMDADSSRDQYKQTQCCLREEKEAASQEHSNEPRLRLYSVMQILKCCKKIRHWLCVNVSLLIT